MRKLYLLLMGVVFFATQAMAQRTITGKVIDEKGNPVVNASVIVKGTTVGTTSKADGTYSINVPANGKTLVISSVDMITEEVNIGTQTSVSVTLKSDDKIMQEVVVVGYGTQKKKEVTSAIGKINPVNIAPLVSPSIDKQLGGRIAGLQVTNPSGLVNQPPRIRIRGTNSINGNNNPLIVLDGVPISTGGFAGFTNDNLLANINPADIESIDVLKDGAATAIYGSQATGGVIQITTKKGRAGRQNFNYSATFGFSKPLNRFDLLNAQQFVTIANEKLNNAGTSGGRAFMNSENTNTDWQDQVFRPSSQASTHNLSFDGGNDKTTYYISFSYRYQEGLVKTNTTENYNVRANIDHKVNRWLRITNNITLARGFDKDQNNGGNALSGSIAAALRALPNVRVMNPALPQFDNYNITTDGSALGSDANTRLIENNYVNIAYVLAKNKFRSKKHRVIDNFTIELKPTNWLTHTTKFGIDFITLDEFFRQDAKHGDGRSVSGRVSNQAANTMSWVAQDYVNVNKSFGKHNLNITFGLEAGKSENNSFIASGTNVADAFFQQQNVISGSYVTQLSGGSYSQGPGMFSYFGRVNYDYKGRYFIQTSFRRDGLSKFAKKNRFGNFPGTSVGWRISNEDFWTGGIEKVINDLKFRASFARVGNPNIPGGNFPFLNLYGVAPYGSISGISAAQSGNADLKWETNEKINYGIDMALIKDRINVVFDYFIGKNNGLVVAVPYPPSLGIPNNQILQNVGTMENKGFEFTLNINAIKSKDFELELGFNYTKLKNKILTLPNNGNDIIISNGTGNYNVLRVGVPYNALYGYQFAGVNSSNGNPVYVKADGSLLMGNINNSSYFSITDLNSPVVGSAGSLAGTDRQILGNSLPTYFGGVNVSARYKQFNVDMLFRYSGGNKIMNITRQESLLNQGFMNSGTEILNRWQKPGDVTSVPRLWYNRDNFTNLNQQASSRFVEKGDFIRFDNLAINYTVNPELLERLFKSAVKSFRFYVQGQNLFVITDYTGIDPDNIDVRGLDYNTIPPARTISFGVNIGF
ncbi:MAG: TonB-dependent receptor [Sphingobacteriales bacterium]|nr:TonB-dependent receptor [Sphingobacteriales bacterium]